MMLKFYEYHAEDFVKFFLAQDKGRKFHSQFRIDLKTNVSKQLTCTCADLAEVMKVTLLIPMAAITNYYKLGGLQEHTFILSLLWRPEVRNQFHWPSFAASGGCRGGFVPGLSGGCGYSLACGHITAVSASLATSPLCLLHAVYHPLPLLNEDACDGLEGPPG